MENGRIVDLGPHGQLVERNAFYSGIYKHQTLIGYVESGEAGGKL
jgi:ABC-type multidrug transport system fused ATPase/permease subunit